MSEERATYTTPDDTDLHRIAATDQQRAGEVELSAHHARRVASYITTLTTSGVTRREAVQLAEHYQAFIIGMPGFYAMDDDE